MHWTLKPLGVSTITLLDRYYPLSHRKFHYSIYNYFTCDSCVLWCIIRHVNGYNNSHHCGPKQHQVSMMCFCHHC